VHTAVGVVHVRAGGRVVATHASVPARHMPSPTLGTSRPPHGSAATSSTPPDPAAMTGWPGTWPTTTGRSASPRRCRDGKGRRVDHERVHPPRRRLGGPRIVEAATRLAGQAGGALVIVATASRCRDFSWLPAEAGSWPRTNGRTQLLRPSGAVLIGCQGWLWVVPGDGRCTSLWEAATCAQRPEHLCMRRP
jgi:hypothetical protein